MTSIKDCCVPGCNYNRNESALGTRIPLHTFPNPETDRLRFNLWLNAIGGDILALNNEHIHKYRRVCNNHFEEKYHCRYKSVSRNAVPTLNIPSLFSRNRSLHFETIPLHEVVSFAEPLTPTDFHQEQRQYSRAGVKRLSEAKSICDSIKDCKKVAVEKKHIDCKSNLIQEGRQYSPLEVKKMVAEKNNIDQELMITEPISNPTLLNESENKILETRTYRNKKLFSKVEKELYNQLVESRAELSKLKQILKNNPPSLKLLKNITPDSCTINAIESSTGTTKPILQMQWKEDEEELNGQRGAWKINLFLEGKDSLFVNV